VGGWAGGWVGGWVSRSVGRSVGRCNKRRRQKRPFLPHNPRSVNVESALVVVVELLYPSVGQHPAIRCRHQGGSGLSLSGTNGTATIRSVNAHAAGVGRGSGRRRGRLCRLFLRRFADPLESALEFSRIMLMATLHSWLARISRGVGRGIRRGRLRRHVVRRLADPLERALELGSRSLALLPQLLAPLDVLLDLARELGVVAVKQLTSKVELLI
jgi:hypothetical protein